MQESCHAPLLGMLPRYGLLQSVEQLISAKVLEAGTEECAYLYALVGDVPLFGNALETKHQVDPLESKVHPHSGTNSDPRSDTLGHIHQAANRTQSRLIMELTAMFPAYNSADIQSCFEQIGWDLEDVTNALLSHALPESIRFNADRLSPPIKASVPSRSLVANYGECPSSCNAR